MVIVLERSISDGDKQRVREYLAARGFQVREIVGEQETIFGAVGIVPIDARDVEQLAGVARVIPITSPFKFASREFRHEDSVIAV
jgi:3-deoxy-7-phosphoheptulonate synthase